MMAIPGDLAAQLADHHRFTASAGREGRRLELVGVDLSKIDLAGQDLSESVLIDARLEGARLTGVGLDAACS
jgi:uncharacterized protein YjbI with pentapeptide repeats